MTVSSDASSLPDVSIAIVSWNTRGLLLSCLQSIKRQVGVAVETIVIDNASRDGSVEAIRLIHPGVRIIANATNIGFAAASNEGLRVAAGRYVLLLNPDTELQPDALRRLVEFADHHPDCGVVGGCLLSPDGSLQYVAGRQLWSVRGWLLSELRLDRLRVGRRLFGNYLMTWWDHRDTRPVPAISGACMLIPRRVLLMLGELDDSHPMYLEDIDYCARALRAGLVNYYVHSARVLHHGGQSSKQARTATSVLKYEAARIFLERYSGRSSVASLRGAIILLHAVRISALAPLSLIARLRHSSPGRSFDLGREVAMIRWALGLTSSAVPAKHGSAP